MRIRAFGRELEITRTDDSWAIFDVGNEGKKRPARDIVVPPGISEEELLVFLEDLLHEHASERYPDVIVIEK